MHLKFSITLEDGKVIESHDNMWNEVRDHAHALLPHNDKKWVRYEIVSDDHGLMVGVDFRTGLFVIKGTQIHPAIDEGNVLTFKSDIQEFPTLENRKILNGLPYFPIFGRKRFLGDWGETLLYFCGWKRREGKRTIEKVAYVYPNTQIVLT